MSFLLGSLLRRFGVKPSHDEGRSSHDRVFGNLRRFTQFYALLFELQECVWKRVVYLLIGVSSGEAEGAECGTHDSSEGVEGAELGR